MSILNILDALEMRLSEVLREFPLKLPYNDPTPFKIFRHKIPERLISEFDYSEKDTHDDVYPFCIIKIDQGKKEANVSMHDSVFNIVIGVKNESHEGQGYDDVMACIQTIWNNFNENPILAGRYKFKYPLNWALENEEDHHPFYFGGIQLQFESHSMQYVGG